MTFSEFFNMGGYAFYVWTAYLLGLIVLLLNFLWPLWRVRRQLRELARQRRPAGGRR